MQQQAPIIGGVAAPEATNIVFIADFSNNTTVACSGALIAPNVVLIDRNCVSDGPSGAVDCSSSTFGAAHDPSKIQVTNDQTMSISGNWWKVTHVAVPPDPGLCEANLALLTLDTVVDTATATPLAPRLDAPVVTGETFTAYGYGATTVGGTDMGTRNKREGVEVTCVGDCGNGGAANVWGSGIGPCTTDGPAVGSDGLLIGIVDRGSADCTAMLAQGFWTHTDWMRSAANAAATAGGYTPPAWVTGTSGGSAGAGGTSGAAGSSSAGAAGAGTAGAASKRAANSGDSGGCAVSAPDRQQPRPVALLFGALLALAGVRRRYADARRRRNSSR